MMRHHNFLKMVLSFFPGNDPSTDLRGCGMLGLLTTLKFAVSLDSKALAGNVYHLSRDDIQNFPFCVMSINVTRICLQITRAGKLNKYVLIYFKILVIC